MKFYNQQHMHYCGIDLHAGKMFVCVMNHKGKINVHKNIKTDPEPFFELIFPYLGDIIVYFAGIGSPDFSPGTRSFSSLSCIIHDTYPRWQNKNDKIDSHEIALLLKGGNFPTFCTHIRPRCLVRTRYAGKRFFLTVGGL